MITTFLIRFAAAVILIGAVFVLTQDLQIFPGAANSIFTRKGVNADPLPDGAESIFIETEDKRKLHMLRLPGDEAGRIAGKTAIIFHGNGGDVFNFFDYQEWFSRLGVTSYGFDYRGFGRSSGWPSEKGLYLDSDAVWRYVLEREGRKPQDIILFGVSLGSALAARLAAKHGSGILILITPYLSMPDLVNDMFLVRYLRFFLWYKLPTVEFTADLKDTSLIIAHGRRDTVIPFRHGERIAAAYKGQGEVRFIASDTAGHNDIFSKVHYEVRNTLVELNRRM